MFYSRSPHLVICDSFLADPDLVRHIALQQEYFEDAKGYKGVRSKPFRWPFLKEEFERLLNVRITDWLDQSQNGVFQKTDVTHPRVWHSDRQTFAGVLYLTPNTPLSGGLSLWRDKTHGCRRPPNHPLEARDNWSKLQEEIYAEHNLLHEDNWELIDRVSALYNRLVLFDGSLIHSVTSYEGFTPENPRLMQLYFFSAVPK